MSEPTIRTGPGGTEARVENGRLEIRRRTYRPGDFVHYVLCFFALLLALTILWIAIRAGTLLRGWVLPALVLATFAWAWFCVTKMKNRRIVTIDKTRLIRRDGPIASIVRTVTVPLDQVAPTRITKSLTFTMPPTSKVVTYNVRAGDLTLFPKLLVREEAEFILAELDTALSAQRGDRPSS